MAHPRDVIGQYVVALLVAASTSAGTRVEATRVEPHKKSLLPALSVYTLNDPVDDELSSEMEVAHGLQLEITGWVTHADAPQVTAAMNALAEEIEIAMRADPYLGGNASDVSHPSTAMQVVEDDSDPLVGIVVLTYTVTYHIALAAT